MRKKERNYLSIIAAARRHEAFPSDWQKTVEDLVVEERGSANGEEIRRYPARS